MLHVWRQRTVDALAGLAVTAGIVALPAVLSMRGWLAATYYAVLDAVSTAALLCLALAGELPTLGTAIVALHTSRAEASSTLAASGPFVLALAACVPLWLCGCRSFWRCPPVLAVHVRHRWLLAAPLLGIWAMPDAAATYPLSLGRIARGLTEFSAQWAFVDRRVVDPFKVSRRGERNELLVFVVGESSSAKHWQINGYERETTPNMQRRLDAGELVNFKAHMSTAAITLFAVPALLSPFDELGGIGAPPRRRSVVTLMSRAGFRTAWLSNNDPQPAGTEADETTYRTDDSVMDIVTNSDDWLATPVDLWLRRTEGGPGFLVLHTYSSHLPFETRYPRQYARWTADGYQRMGYSRNQTRDNYDNSILYTDAFLESVIARLEHDLRPTLMVYTSDHAETIMDGVARPDAPRDERLLHVPLLFWANRAWKESHYSQWASLQAFARTGQATSHVNLVPTVTGLLGIVYEGRPRHRDVLDGSFQAWRTTPALASDERSVVRVAPPAARQGARGSEKGLRSRATP